MIERVTEAETVEVGRYYLVPCVLIDNRDWWPVIGPAHEDCDVLGRFSPAACVMHMHHDWRFVSEHQKARMGRSFSADAVLTTIANMEKLSPPQWRRRKCIRVAPEITNRVPWLAMLESAYTTARIKPDCRICPHRGLPLNGLPIVDGAVTCPGHGLRWNVETGALVRRV